MDKIREQLEGMYRLCVNTAEAQLREEQAALAQSMQQHAADLEQREAELAAAMEMLSIDPAVRAAFNEGILEERSRVLALIDQQLDYLKRGGISHAALSALRRAVDGNGF